jgi:hypothetical protein
VRKFDFQGNELWSREFAPPAPQGISLVGVAANASCVCVLGIHGENGEMILRKFSPRRQ